MHCVELIVRDSEADYASRDVPGLVLWTYPNAALLSASLLPVDTLMRHGGCADLSRISEH